MQFILPRLGSNHLLVLLDEVVLGEFPLVLDLKKCGFWQFSSGSVREELS